MPTAHNRKRSTHKRIFGTSVDARGASAPHDDEEEFGARRQAQLADQLQRTALLTRLSLELRVTRDTQLIVEQILRVLSANTDAEQASIILLAADGSVEAATALNAGRIEPLVEGRASQVLERGLAGWALRQGCTVIVPDVANDPRWAVLSSTRPNGSAMVTPLSYAYDTLGVLTITHRAIERFGSQDLLLIEGIAAQAGVAISAARHFMHERRRREQALQLFAMSQFLAGERSKQDLAHELLSKSITIFDVAGVALYFPAEETSELGCFLAHPPAGNGAADGRAAAIAAQAWQQQMPITMSAEHDDTQALFALPLRHNGASIGAIVLARSGQAVFPAETWSLLTIFTNSAAAAFANQQLIERLSQRASELERLVDERTAQLKHSRDMLRLVFDNLPDGLVLMDSTAHILAANNAFCRAILGRRPQQVVGQHYPAIIAELARAHELEITRHRGDEAGSWRICRTDTVGQQRWYAVDRLLIENDGQQQYLERWRDVTRQEELQRELVVQQQLTALARLAASMAHELGNPLQTVQGCLDLCREDGGLNPTSAEYLALADAELERMGALLMRLRALYRHTRPPTLDPYSADLSGRSGPQDERDKASERKSQ
jgi:PAS domain S-box-containing protein